MRPVLFSILLASMTVAAAEPRTGAAPVSASLTLPYDKILPGVPFDVEVTLRNGSSRPVKIGTIAHLVVTRADGSAVSIPPGAAARLQPYLVSGDDTFIELKPGESVQRVVGWDLASPPNWSSEEGFSAPGSYGIALDLELGHHLDDDDLSNYVGTLRTSRARLTRAVSPGVDETIWNRMLQTSEGHWSDDALTRLAAGKQLAKEIIELHPESAYYPYALLLHSFVREQQDIPRLLEAAERFPDSPAHAYLLKAAGDAAYRESGHAAHENDRTRSADFAALAEKYYQQALDTARLSVKAAAEIGLQRAAWEREKASKKQP